MEPRTEPVTPNELARDLSVTAKTIREWLRQRGFRPEVEKGTRWQLTEEQASLVRNRFQL